MNARKAAYDRLKAHEYYMKHRKLKGRKKAAPKITSKLKDRKNKKKKRIKVTKAHTLATTTQKGGKAVKLTSAQHEAYNDSLKAKLEQIKERLNNLPPKQKQAVKRALEQARKQLKKG